MGASTTMEKRGHHICKLVNYEVMIYQKKNKVEGGMTDIKLAAQKVYDILKNDGKTQLVDKKLIKRYNLN